MTQVNVCASQGHRVADSAHVLRPAASPFTSLRQPPDALGLQRWAAWPVEVRMRLWIRPVVRSAQRGQGGGLAKGRPGGHERSGVRRRPDLAPTPEPRLLT